MKTLIAILLLSLSSNALAKEEDKFKQFKQFLENAIEGLEGIDWKAIQEENIEKLCTKLYENEHKIPKEMYQGYQKACREVIEAKEKEKRYI